MKKTVELKKDITFIYMDYAERCIMEVLSEEAQKRGYSVRLSNNKFEKCEIGVYCQHVNFPNNSKFSVIMLHDIIQQYSRWPDLWKKEPWNIYDVGILPSDQWVKNWDAVSDKFYARPRVGMYKVGWPKADAVANIDRNEYAEQFYKDYNLDPSKKTVLYAPAWENDNKEDEFVRAMLDLNVNILIKQYPATMEIFPQQYLNAKAMYELHKDIPGVTILDSKTNIFNAILASDILVSEESSTMAEALMMGIPSVSVSDWLIPDVVPSRLPKCDYDFVIKTKKAQLAECISSILNDYSKYKEDAENWRDKTFCNIGCSTKIIVDIIDDCVNKREVKYEALRAKEPAKVKLTEKVSFAFARFRKVLYYKYISKTKLLKRIWNYLRNIEKRIKK